MDTSSSDFTKSVLTSSSKTDPLPINRYKLSDKEILGEFPNTNEEQLERIKDDLLIISEILYNNFYE